MAMKVDISYLRSLEAKPRSERLLEAALSYAKEGSRVVPLVPNSKIPAIENWPITASSNPDQIRHWFGPEGEHRNGNIALLIGGFKVVDIDRHGDIDGFKTLAGATANVACPRAITPNNGEHLIASRTDLKDAPGVEILGDGKLFTVYPSEIDGNRYAWKMGGTPAPVLRVKAVDSPAAVATTAVALAPAPYVRTLLEFIEPDCDYSTWLRVGMAIHHNDAGDIGQTLWDEWSKGGRKYKPGECERKWDTFDAERGKPTTMKWLIVEALKNGKPQTREDMLYHGSLAHSLEIEKVNEKYGLFDAGGEIYVAYLERGDLHMASPFNFKVKTANWKIESEGKLKPISEVWFEHPDRRIITEIGMWDIGKEPEGALNLFHGFAVQPVPCEPEEVKFFTDFVVDDICRGNQKYAGFLFDMLSTKLRNPMALLKLCLVLRGGEGVGKGALTRVMENIIGPQHSVNVSSAENWLGTFSGTLMKDALWVSANEAHWSGNHSHGERLKALISEEWVDMQEKFVKARQQRNRVMIAITTNNEWAVPASQDSRRYFVLDVSDNRADDPKFWDEFNALMGTHKDGTLQNPEYLGKVMYWLQTRKIENDLKRAMETEWLVRQRKESAQESREEVFIGWIRSTFTGDLPNDVITGAGGYSFVRATRSDGRNVVRVDKMYEDYRTYVNRRTKKLRMTYDQGMFNTRMSVLGMTITRVRRGALTVGGHKIPGESETKISVMSLPSEDEIEANITKYYGLFAMDTEEEEEQC